MDKLDYDKQFEWQGVFWSPDDGVEYNGSVKYTPGEGIRLNLFRFFKDSEELNLNCYHFKKLILHGVIEYLGNTSPITLFEVYGGMGYSLAPFRVQRTESSAEALVLGRHCLSKNMLGVCVSYGGNWNSLFFHNSVDEIGTYEKQSKPVQLDKDREISLFHTFRSHFVSKPMLDNIFYSHDKEKLKNFKEEVSVIIKKYEGYIFLKESNQPYVKFSAKGANYNTLIAMEEYSRFFWEFLLRDKIPVMNSFCVYTSENGATYFPLLSQKLLSKNFEVRKGFLPLRTLNKYSFGSQTGNWEQMEISLRHWFTVFEDREWQPISHLILKLREKLNICSPSDYLALVTSIETFMSLTGHDNSGSAAVLKDFIREYKTVGWCKQFRKKQIRTKLGVLCHLKGKVVSREVYIYTIAKYFAELRNVIAHPKSRHDEKKKVYAAIAADEIELSRAYAFLCALMVKAILLYCKDINKDNIDVFMMEFLRYESSVDYVWGN